MLAGIALMAVVTASLASWLLDKVREVEEHAQAATRADARNGHLRDAISSGWVARGRGEPGVFKRLGACLSWRLVSITR